MPTRVDEAPRSMNACARCALNARELRVSERELATALERMKRDLPAMVGQQLAWLRETGFVEVSCSYRNLIFADILGEQASDCA